MKLRARIVWDYGYDVPDDREERIRLYQTADPGEIAKTEAVIARANPLEFMEMFMFNGTFTVTVEPVNDPEDYAGTL
jgi:hypothetical protein